MIKFDLARQVTSFGAVGVTASIVHVVVALTVNSAMLAGPILSNCAGYACAFGVSYLGNCVVTFRRPAVSGRQLSRFVAMSLAGFALNQTIVFVAVKRAHFPFKFALVAAVLAVALATFIVSRFWVFGARDRRPDPHLS